jgi:hypothetical protein
VQKNSAKRPSVVVSRIQPAFGDLRHPQAPALVLRAPDRAAVPPKFNVFGLAIQTLFSDCSIVANAKHYLHKPLTGLCATPKS